MIVRLSDQDEPIDAPPGRDPWGLNAKDEVWDGVYVVMPDPNDEHQEIATTLGASLVMMIQVPGLGAVRIGGNTSDRGPGWTRNYRIPDLSVFLAETAAINLGTHWQGGPDFAAEILSEDDRAREKIPFYAANGVQELLIVDREPWALELYRLGAGALTLHGVSTPDDPRSLASGILPITFRLIIGQPRPRIEVTHHDGIQRWEV